jgi:F-type H+-transporting ATPase subunit b
MTPEVTQAVAEVAKPGVLDTLGINWKLFLAQLLNVAIIMVVLRTWVFKPLGKLLEDRRKKIDDGLKHATEADKRLKSAKEQEEAMLAEARVEAHKAVEEGRQQGEKKRQEQLAQAKVELEQQIEDAKGKISQERTDALDAVRKEVAHLVMAATRKVSSGEIDDKEQRAAIEQAIKELETSKA